MAEYFRKIFIQIRDFLFGLSPGRKIAIAVLAVVIFVSLSGLFYWAAQKSYRPLMSNLNPEDSANIIRILREKNIPFRVSGNGKDIEIPPESIHDLRHELATMGLPQSSVVGYELFDKQSIGTTNFIQKVNQKRALEGELMRTINTIKGVKRTRVHLAIPNKTAFIEDQKKPTASVVLALDNGVRLSEKEIYGIGNLVASAVEGLEVEDVVILNSSGKLLSKTERDSVVALSATQLEFRKKLEEDLEGRVVSILGPVVGDGKVVAKVSADLDFSQVRETQTNFDADGSAVRSSVVHDNRMNATRPGPYGAAGAQSNTPGQPPEVNQQVKTDTTNVKTTNNYEVPQTVRQVQREVGAVRKLSVAVVLDNQQIKTTDETTKAVQAKSQAWSPEKITEFQNVVARAVGLDPKRGDTIEIKNIEFNKMDFSEAEELIQQADRRAYFKNLTLYLVIGLIIVLFFMFVVRPFIKWVTDNTIDSVDTFLPQTIEELEKLQKNQVLPGFEEVVPTLPDKMDPEKVEGEMIKEKIITLIEGNPQKAALVLRDWIRSEKKPDANASAG